jgi:hypothetical protein
MRAAHPGLRLVLVAYRPMQMRGLMLDGRLPILHQVDELAGSPRHARPISLMALVAMPIGHCFTRRRSTW